MTAKRIKKLTVEEYVELERSTGIKHEYHDGIVYPIRDGKVYRNGKTVDLAGGSLSHSILCSKVNHLLSSKLIKANKECFTFNSEMKLRIEKFNKYFYPDAMVVCGDFKQPKDFEDAIINPVLIVEVLSESTEAYDRGDKFHKYRGIETFQEYLLVSQHKAVVDVFYRKPKTQTWEFNRYEGFETTFKLQSLAIEIAMKALYERIVFKEASKK